MNYLAHAYLSNNNKNLILGNFIADHIKGNNYKEYPNEIINGILLHRKIDTFTDQHQQFKLAKRFFYDGFEKYSGILIDIYFDYFLAKNFTDYCTINLPSFTKQVYSIYDDFKGEMPKSGQNFFNYILKTDLYNTYANIDGIEKVLLHLSYRIKHGILLNESIKIFIQNEKELFNCFTILINEITAELTSNTNGFYK